MAQKPLKILQLEKMVLFKEVVIGVTWPEKKCVPSKITVGFFLSRVCQMDCEADDGDSLVQQCLNSLFSRLIFRSFLIPRRCQKATLMPCEQLERWMEEIRSKALCSLDIEHSDLMSDCTLILGLLGAWIMDQNQKIYEKQGHGKLEMRKMGNSAWHWNKCWNTWYCWSHDTQHGAQGCNSNNFKNTNAFSVLYFFGNLIYKPSAGPVYK